MPTYSGSVDSRLIWKGLIWEGGPAQGDVVGLSYVRGRWYDPQAGRFIRMMGSDLAQRKPLVKCASGKIRPHLPLTVQARLRQSKSSLIVTPVRISWHEAGAAVDFGPNSNAGHMDAIQRAMTQAGFIWGGTFTQADGRHFQSQPAGTSPTGATVKACAQTAGD